MAVYLYDAVRTPRGKGRPGGGLSTIAPARLVASLVKALEARVGAECLRAAEHLTLGCVTQSGAQGGHIALIARLLAGLPNDMACLSVNTFCASGLSAIADGARRVASGQCGLVLAGGVESMSQVPFLGDGADYYTDLAVAAEIGWAPPGIGADLVATLEGFTREDLDAWTLRSHRRAAAAWANGAYVDRVVPVMGADGAVALAHDENVRDFGDGEALARLAPVFAPAGAQGYDDIVRGRRPDLDAVRHVHTIAHCPPIADGAALVVLGDADAGRRFGLKPLAQIRAIAETAADPIVQLTGGFAAMDKALARAGLSLGDLGAIEFMEAFAAIPAKFERDRRPDLDRVNIHGGHLAMGHPMGATGAVLTVALMGALEALDAETGLVVATGGSGIGAAMVVDRC